MKNTFFKASSLVLFYALFLMMIFIRFITKVDTIATPVILPLFFCILFIIRLYVRWKKLKNLSYFHINEKDYTTDAKRRADQLGDIVAIIVYIFLALSVNEEIFNQFGNSTLGVSVLCSIFYFISASVSISKNSKVFKVITILISTIQGFLFMLVGIMLILSCILSVVNGYGFKVMDGFFTVFNVEFIISLSYIAESFLIETIIIMTASIFLLTVLIITTPPYQLEELSTAFNIANLIIIMLGVGIYFYANVSWVNIQEFVNKINGNEIVAHELRYSILTTDFKNYLQEFSKSNIINMGYILFLPYTLGAIISSLVIEILKKNYIKRASYAIDALMDESENRHSNYLREEDCILRKQYIYYGGDKNLLKVFDRFSYSMRLVEKEGKYVGKRINF